jgi:hypothetical protein
LSYTYTNIHANSHTDADRNPYTHSNAGCNAAASPESRA